MPVDQPDLSVRPNASTSFAVRRSCQEPGCATLLSLYNEYDYCSVHQPMIIPRLRGRTD